MYENSTYPALPQKKDHISWYKFTKW
jgi:hypothetical protein